MISDSTTRWSPQAWVVALAVTASALTATEFGRASVQPTLYEQLRAATLTSAGHLQQARFQVDRAELTFDGGELYLLSPVAGRRTGAVYIGKGRIRVEPPNPIERDQFDKYLDEPNLDLEFKSLVLRFTDDTADRLSQLAGPAQRPDSRKASRLYRERHDKALEERLLNLDSRVLLDVAERRFGLAPQRPGYFSADVDGRGWFTYEVDPFRVEEISIYKTHSLRRAPDRWSSFHRLADYDVAEGTRHSPLAGPLEVAEHWLPAAAVPEVRTDVAIDGSGAIVAVTDLLIEAGVPTSVVRLTLSSLLEVNEVRWIDSPEIETGDTELDAPADPDQPHPLSGTAVPFIQERLGRGLDEDLWEPQVTVLLPRPVMAGERFVLQVGYSGALFDRLPNRDFLNRDPSSWYPQHPHARRSRFTTVFRSPERMRVASGGLLQSTSVVDGTRIELRSITEPVIGMSFHFGRLDADEYHPDGLPPLTVYSSPNTSGIDIGNREKTRSDIVGSIELFTEYYGPPPFDSLMVTQTPTASAKSFHGFILLSFGTFAGIHTGEAELFRSHELAHQWWGNSVTWDSYHDQWMSEGFAQYSAALYALKARRDESQFVEMMSAWRKDVLGKVDVRQRLGLSHYGLPHDVLRMSDGTTSGPIWLGPRLTSNKTPFDYRILAYEKGAYVLHMLRMMLMDWENDDDARFRQLMRDFQQRYRGGAASTLDFLEAAERAAGKPLDWFFDQWVYGVEVPTYRPELRARRTDSGWRLAGSVHQEDVAEGFRMPVPVRIHFADGSAQVIILEIDRPTVQVDAPLRGEPADIEFNALSSVLATVD